MFSQRGGFETTRWTLVLAAGDRCDPKSDEALSSLCRTYWSPAYAYVRGRGFARQDAEDLTQGFFTQLIEKKSLRLASPSRGRFRSFLLTSLKHYLANEWHRERAQKRGGGLVFPEADLGSTERRVQDGPATWTTPEHLYLKEWALTLLQQALDQLRREMRARGQERRFEGLNGFLTGERTGVRYKEAAEQLNMTEGAVKVAVHRMRGRFGELLRSAVADTVSSSSGGEVEEEISSLLDAVAS